MLGDLNSASELLASPTNLSNNIRISPKQEQFCQRKFVWSCRKNPMVLLPTKELARAEVMELVEDWFKHGL